MSVHPLQTKRMALCAGVAIIAELLFGVCMITVVELHNPCMNTNTPSTFCLAVHPVFNLTGTFAELLSPLGIDIFRIPSGNLPGTIEPYSLAFWLWRWSHIGPSSVLVALFYAPLFLCLGALAGYTWHLSYPQKMQP